MVNEDVSGPASSEKQQIGDFAQVRASLHKLVD